MRQHNYLFTSLVMLTWGIAACSPVPEDAAIETAAPEEPVAPAAAPSLESESNITQTETHVFEKIADGVYFATGTGAIALWSNSLVIVNEDDVLVVDSHVTADAGRELEKSIAALTDKPVGQLVNSHFHFDHAHGNQVFAGRADIIGHEYTRTRLLGDVLNEATYRVIGSPEAQMAQLEGLDELIESAPDAAMREFLTTQKNTMPRHIRALAEVVPTPPDVTFTDRLTIQGSREIQLLHLGRGHTAGDVVVYLPADGIVFTGDLLYPSSPYLGDGYADEFITTLERIKDLNPTLIAGGHGPLIRDPLAAIEKSQAYLRTYWDQVRGFYEEGRSVTEAVSAIDLSGYEDFAAFQMTTPGVFELEVTRMYERLAELLPELDEG